MNYYSSYIEKKRNLLNKLIEENSFNLLSDEIIKASQELDQLIYEYLLYKQNNENYSY
ncbi:aspartyl-phosphate phosphatase Spo0E family protein [Clostridium grantii]|uniref:Spo0E like sporulation regulatory protein n=1 Tax=Clostridium grantii DSM 8605 TaxID=1121316 RepID=A0A1M5RC57_9CLOT|nr:aspartyl-phosphate phosphatase Spo0E family protein [Clostridium grantii]SHH23922.1 Spo0E like sporulation regulatory protein [Clostridium grantii DSM 8605]